jgi:hypothetical protein
MGWGIRARPARQPARRPAKTASGCGFRSGVEMGTCLRNSPGSCHSLLFPATGRSFRANSLAPLRAYMPTRLADGLRWKRSPRPERGLHPTDAGSPVPATQDSAHPNYTRFERSCQPRVKQTAAEQPQALSILDGSTPVGAAFSTASRRRSGQQLGRSNGFAARLGALPIRVYLRSFAVSSAGTASRRRSGQQLGRSNGFAARLGALPIRVYLRSFAVSSAGTERPANSRFGG